MIRSAKPSDAVEITQIYNHYVKNTIITFAENPVSIDEMSEKMKAIQSKYPWLVCESDGMITGYAYASEWRARSAYRFSVESTVYLHPDHLRKGIGSQLYEALIRDLKAKSFHVVMGVIALPNPASVALHEKLEFEKVGQLKEIGFKFNQWIDVGYWEKQLKIRNSELRMEKTDYE